VKEGDLHRPDRGKEEAVFLHYFRLRGKKRKKGTNSIWHPTQGPGCAAREKKKMVGGGAADFHSTETKKKKKKKKKKLIWVEHMRLTGTIGKGKKKG